MCGIVGALGSPGASLSPALRAQIRHLGTRLARRGPDALRHHSTPEMELVFTRLAIVGGEQGTQPFVSRDGAIIVVVNGEIFNHQAIRARLGSAATFTTPSDGEAVLHLYEHAGLAGLEQLDGMFAFCIWDGRQRRAILGRDRLGIKPLFMHVQDGLCTFASEIKALVGLPQRPITFDWDAALAEPWLVGAPMFTATRLLTSFFTGVEHVPAGTFVIWDATTGHVQRQRYWRLDQAATQADIAPDATPAMYIDAYRERLAASVHKCLMGEAEIGLFLSGGLDSAAVAALARHQAYFHSFTVLSSTTVASGDYAHAQALAAALQLPLHGAAFPPHQIEDYARLWPQIVRACETPYCGPEQLLKYGLYAVAKTLRPGLRVMLSGQGSDEFNGGYTALFAGADAGWPSLMRQLEWLAQGETLQQRQDFARAWDQYLGPGLLHSTWLHEHAPDSDSLWQRYVATKYRDLQMYNLWHEDRLAAHYSIENRVPFLDHHLVALCLAIPAALRPQLLWDKTIAREALRGLLPDPWRCREKVPFFYGTGAEATAQLMLALCQAQDGALVDYAFAPGSIAATVVNRDHVRQRLQDAGLSGDTTHWELLLRLVNMGVLEQCARDWQQDHVPDEAPVTLQPMAHLETLPDAAAVRAGLQLPDVRFQPELALQLAPSVQLTRPLHQTSGPLLVLMGYQVLFTIDDPALITLLESLEGAETFAALAARLPYTAAELAPLVNKAIDAQILTIVSEKETVVC